MMHAASACLRTPAGQHIIVSVYHTTLAVKSGRARPISRPRSESDVRTLHWRPCIELYTSVYRRVYRSWMDVMAERAAGSVEVGQVFHDRFPYAVICPRLNVVCRFCLGFNIEFGPMLWLRGRASATDFWTRFCGRGGPPCGQFLDKH